MTTMQNPEQFIGRTAVDRNGDKIGKIGQVYLDDATGQPSWVAISTGMFGSRESFAPLAGASPRDDDLALAVDKDLVKNAPNVEDDGHLDPGEEKALYDHYAAVLGGGPAQPTAGAGEKPRKAKSRRGSDDAMTRSEEQLQLGTEQVEAGRARLRKYVVTENVTQTVPVSHEEVRVEREPVTDANRGEAASGQDISEAEHEITLHAERPVVDKETVPVERVRMDTETVTEQQTVDDTVRKEQIDVEGGSDTTDRRGR